MSCLANEPARPVWARDTLSRHAPRKRRIQYAAGGRGGVSSHLRIPLSGMTAQTVDGGKMEWWPAGSGDMRRPLVPLAGRPNPTDPGDAADLSTPQGIGLAFFFEAHGAALGSSRRAEILRG